MPKVLESILSDFCGQLPKLTGEASYFPNFLIEHLREYQKTITSSTNFLESLYKNDDLEEREDSFLKQLQEIIQGLTRTLEIYLSGLPSTAYIEFKKTITETYLKFSLQSTQIRHIKRDHNFYRVRTSNANLASTDLFHIPFEKRKLVSTQRFSIPGFPCLYLGDSLSVCLKELDVFTNDRLPEIKIVRFTNNSNILIADIDPYQIPKRFDKPVLGNEAKKSLDIYQAALLYPLIAACHCKILYTANDAKFKIEYVIPQLLLQWFKENSENKLIQGIRYLSNRIDKEDNIEKMYNYVFPVVDSKKESGLCSHLKHQFKITSVLDVSKFSFRSSLFSEQVVELEKYLDSQPVSIL